VVAKRERERERERVEMDGREREREREKKWPRIKWLLWCDVRGTLLKKKDRRFHHVETERVEMLQSV